MPNFRTDRLDLSPSRRTLLVAMSLSVAAVLGLGLGSTGTEMDAALSRLAVEQSFLALTVAHDLASRLALTHENAELTRQGSSSPAALPRAPVLGNVLNHLKVVQREGQLLVLVRLLGERRFVAPDYRLFESPQLHAAFARSERHVVLDRNSAKRLGLAQHRALAGLATVAPPDTGTPPLQIAVIRSAAPERERVFRAQWRNVLTGLTAIAVVLWFGRLALRQQRRELSLAGQLQGAQLAADRDAQLARADRFAMLAALSTGIAHELGSPLSVIVGRIEQLGMFCTEDEHARRALSSMNEQAERMNGIIRGFLALARGESPLLERTPPREVVEAARELVKHRFEQAEVELQVELPEGLPEVALDARLFTQVLVNLLVNACEASCAGAAVRLSVLREPTHVCFEVSDQGAGIQPDTARRATEPFFTTRAHEGGSGLGLAIVNELVQQHGGSLALLPARAQRGTIARVRLPRAAPARDDGAERSPS